MVLYLANSSLDARTVGWSMYDGTSQKRYMPGDADEPPYPNGLEALKDGWRLFQASQLVDRNQGDEFRLGHLKYEFFFEKMVDCD